MNVRIQKGLQVLAAVVVAAMVWMPVQGFSAVTYNWKIPKNTRIVQTDPDTVDNVRVFSSIQAAIDSITDAGELTPYIVKIMPGPYNLVTGSVTMKPFVNLIGSGQESTKIYSVSNNAGTVRMANNTSLEDLWVQNNSTSGESSAAITVGPYSNVTINRVKAEGKIGAIHSNGTPGITGSFTIKNSTAVGYDQYGILVGPYGKYDVKIDNVTAVCDSTSEGNCGGIQLWYGNDDAVNLDITNSVLKAMAPNCISSSRIAAMEAYGQNNSTVKISNVTAESVNAGGCRAYGIHAAEGTSIISNSRVSATGSTSYGIAAGGVATVVNNSSISGETYGVLIVGGPDDPVKIGGSLISGDISTLRPTDKIVNCHDGNYNPIPNQ